MRKTMTVLAFGAALAAPLAILPATAQEFPAKSMTMILGQPAGTSVDLTMRYYANKVQALTGQQVIVENKPGAGVTIAAKALTLARPDGYTMFLGTTASQSANRYLYKTLSYDPAKDMTPVSMLFRLAFMLAVNEKKTPVKSVAELTAYLKAKKEPILYGWATASMLASGELYKNLIGIQATPVGYRGSQQQMADLSSGEYDFTFTDAAYGVAPVANQRSLAVTLDKRSTILTDLPTMVEAGLPDFQHLYSWFGVYLPANAPKPLVDRLNTLFNQITANPDTPQFLRAFAGEPFPSTPEFLAQFQESEAKRWEALVKLAKIEPQ